MHDGVDYAIDPKNGVALLDNGVSGFQCRCSSGCNEVTPCEGLGAGSELTCSGVCSGTSTDGVGCAFCSWHIVDVPSPGGSPGSNLDPTGDPIDKPPGIDPTSGELDPTYGPELPPLDPGSGELDPTK